MARTKAEVISEMVDSELFTDDEIRDAVKQSQGMSAPEVSSSPSMAAQAASIVTPTPSAQTPSTMGGWISRLGRAAKETAMAPIAPWLALSKNKGLQDIGNRAISPAPGQVGVSQLAQEIGDAGRESIRNAGQNTAEKIATSPLANVSPNLAAGLGAAVGTATDAGLAMTPLTPRDVASQVAGSAPGIIGGIAMDKAQQFLKEAQKLSATSSFGGMKSVFNKTRGGSQAFADSSVAMQDKGALSWFNSAEDKLNRVEEIKQAAGAEMGRIHGIIDASGAPPLNAQDIASKIEKELTPKISGTMTEPARRQVEKIVQTIKANGEAPSFETMGQIKAAVNPGKWGDFQTANMGEDSRKIFELRQRATAIIGKAMDDGVASATTKTPEIAQKYLDAKKTYGMASDVYKGISDKVERVWSNRLLDLGSGGIASVGLLKLVQGQPAQALSFFATAAGSKYLRSFGPQQGAIIFKALSDGLSASGKVMTPEVQRLFAQGASTGFRSIINRARKKK